MKHGIPARGTLSVLTAYLRDQSEEDRAYWQEIAKKAKEAEKTRRESERKLKQKG